VDSIALPNALHDLKVWPTFFPALMDGSKPFEIRKNDRDFRVGDTLLLREWDPASETYSGRYLTKHISYVTDWQQQPGYVVLGIERSPAIDEARVAAAIRIERWQWEGVDLERLEPWYSHWVGQLTAQGLHSKADIATVMAMLSQYAEDNAHDALRLHREKMVLIERALAAQPSNRTADALDRLRLAMLFIEEWSNWWSFALAVDDAKVTPEQNEAAGKMAESLGARARDMVIDNRRFLAAAS